ncbi:MAG: Lipopolysaccharide heptosyltransferase [Pedosphaera sp.]|nr:Lipopolysaccharide heptosyltransferase [Pedosphaera sp.]
MPSSPPQRILVRGVNWLGDAVMSTPALLRLREARPEAHITLLTHEKLHGVWVGHPAINSVLTFKADESAWAMGRRLRQEQFHIGLTLPNSPRSAFELWLGGIPQRIGYARPWRNWLLTQRVPSRPGTVAMRKRSAAEINRLVRENSTVSTATPPASAHHIHQYLHLTAALGASTEPLPPHLGVHDTVTARIVARFNLTAGRSPTPLWFGLNAGAEYGPAKRWPEESFVEAAIQIQRRTKCRWMIFGLQSEMETCVRIASNIYRATEEEFGREEVARHPHVINLAGATNLRELCAALKFCQVVLTNDSGPMHVAAAVGTPVVVPFGSTSPELTGPGLPGDTQHSCLRAPAPCAPCFLRTCPIDFRCMTGITVSRVVEAVVTAATARRQRAAM